MSFVIPLFTDSNALFTTHIFGIQYHWYNKLVQYRFVLGTELEGEETSDLRQRGESGEQTRGVHIKNRQQALKNRSQQTD